VSGKLPQPTEGGDEILKWETKAEKAACEIYLLVESDQGGYTSEGMNMTQ